MPLSTPSQLQHLPQTVMAARIFFENLELEVLSDEPSLLALLLPWRQRPCVDLFTIRAAAAAMNWGGS